MHQDAPLAAQASMAAHEQGKFWEYHDKLFANPRALKRPDLEKYAQETGLDMNKFKAALDSNKFQKPIAEDQRLASTVGARGTPYFFINGRPLSGAKPKAEFEKIIKEEIAIADKMIAGGIPVARVYGELMKTAKASPSAAGQQRARRPGTPDPNAVYKVPLGEAPRKGGKQPKVTIVEFSDFQ